MTCTIRFGYPPRLRVNVSDLHLILLHLLSGNVGQDGGASYMHLFPGGHLHSLPARGERSVPQDAIDSQIGIGIQIAQIPVHVKAAMELSGRAALSSFLHRSQKRT